MRWRHWAACAVALLHGCSAKHDVATADKSAKIRSGGTHAASTDSQAHATLEVSPPSAEAATAGDLRSQVGADSPVSYWSDDLEAQGFLALSLPCYGDERVSIREFLIARAQQAYPTMRYQYAVRSQGNDQVVLSETLLGRDRQPIRGFDPNTDFVYQVEPVPQFLYRSNDNPTLNPLAFMRVHREAACWAHARVSWLLAHDVQIGREGKLIFPHGRPAEAVDSPQQQALKIVPIPDNPTPTNTAPSNSDIEPVPVPQVELPKQPD